MDLVDFKKSVGLQLWAKRWTTRLTRSRLTSRHASSSWSVGFFVWIPAMELHEEKGYDLLVHDFRTKEQTHSDNVDRQGRWISKGFFQDLQYPIALSFFSLYAMLSRMREGFEEANFESEPCSFLRLSISQTWGHPEAWQKASKCRERVSSLLSLAEPYPNFCAFFWIVINVIDCADA